MSGICFLFVLGGSIDALNRIITLRVGIKSLLQILLRWFWCACYSKAVVFFVYGCMGVDIYFWYVVWTSIFSCATVNCRAFCARFAVCIGVVGVTSQPR